MVEEIIARGAEAILLKNDGKIIKRRLKKKYRLDELDKKIRQGRTRREAKLLEKASKVIPIPKIISLNEHTHEICMEHISGKKISDSLDNVPRKKSMEICKLIGENIAKIHNQNIMHGDLTTSNMIYSDKEKKLYFIDFGLGFHSERVEDRAVDLHLLKEALESKHFKNWKEYLKIILEYYKKEGKNASMVFGRLKKVESRGRYKGKH